MTLNPDKALIFRIVRRDNLPWILDHGLQPAMGKFLIRITATSAMSTSLENEIIGKSWLAPEVH
jgi:hypothetical protein